MSALTSIIKKMNQVFDGDPWYGKSVLKILAETDPSTVYVKPNSSAHSVIDLLYHMINWEEFVLHQLDGSIKEPQRYEQLDWRPIDPAKHVWHDGVAEYTGMHKQIVDILSISTDDILDRPVKYRNYNMRVLLDGLIDHNIYHAGQIALLKKLTVER